MVNEVDSLLMKLIRMRRMKSARDTPIAAAVSASFLAHGDGTFTHRSLVCSLLSGDINYFFGFSKRSLRTLVICLAQMSSSFQ